MNVTDDAIRESCTDAVYERGETYRAEGRIRRMSRFGESVTAVVSGSRDYDVGLDLSGSRFDSWCNCPYDGPGTCKHVVAVLLALTDDLPEDDHALIDPVLEDAAAEDLREFLRDELATDPSLRDRFLARFGESTARSTDELRADLDRLFEETNPASPVVFDPIDFSGFVDLAEEHRAQGDYRSAVTVYRVLVAGLDDNMDLVDGSYDHFAQAFRRALDGYVDCVACADFDPEETAGHAQFLDERAASGTEYLRDQFVKAADDLRARTASGSEP